HGHQCSPHLYLRSDISQGEIQIMIGRSGHAIGITFLGGLLLTSSICVAQLSQRSELGFGIGAFNYSGDLVRTYSVLDMRPAGTVFYRNNISKVVSFRTSLTVGKLAASDKRPIDS